MSAPEPVSVHVWGELRGEQKMPGVLRVLVGGQDAGGVIYDAADPGLNGPWIAQVHGLQPGKPSSHPTALEAVRAITRSSWGRRLGARAASDLHWSDRARRVVDRASRTGGAR